MIYGKRFIFIFLALAYCKTPLQAATAWTLENISLYDIEFSCDSLPVSGKEQLSVSGVRVPHKTNKRIVWEQAYNEGAGMDAATWECQVGEEGDENPFSVTLTTKRNEHITLQVSRTVRGWSVTLKLR